VIVGLMAIYAIWWLIFRWGRTVHSRPWSREPVTAPGRERTPRRPSQAVGRGAAASSTGVVDEVRDRACRDRPHRVVVGAMYAVDPPDPAVLNAWSICVPTC
jgi:hypothetical protein